MKDASDSFSGYNHHHHGRWENRVKIIPEEKKYIPPVYISKMTKQNFTHNCKKKKTIISIKTYV